MCAQVPVNAGTLDADECAQVQAGPRRVWGRNAEVGSLPISMGIPASANSNESTLPPRPLHCPLALTGGPAVHADRVPLGIADGLDGHGFTLAVCAQLQKGLGLLLSVPLSQSPTPQTLTSALPSNPPTRITLTLLLSQHCRLAKI